jgi:hypothetical protein
VKVCYQQLRIEVGGSFPLQVVPVLFYNHDDALQYDSEQKAAKLNGRTFPQPRLVWRVDSGELKIRALAENKRPAAGTALAVAPFWNSRMTAASALARCAGPFMRRLAQCPTGSRVSMRAPLSTPMSDGLDG